MLDEYCNILGEEEVCEGKDEDFTSVGGRNADNYGVSCVTPCVPNNWMYGRLDTELLGGMVPTSPQAPPPPFDRQRTGNAIAVDGIVGPRRAKELDCRFEEDRRGWESRVQDFEEEVRRFRSREKRTRGVTRMVLGFIREVTLS